MSHWCWPVGRGRGRDSVIRYTIWYYFTKTCNFKEHQKNLGTDSSREPALTFVSWQTLVHPLVAWKTVTILLCKHTVLQWFCRLIPTVVLIPVICGLHIEWRHSKGLFFFENNSSRVDLDEIFVTLSCWKCTFKSLKFSERERRRTIKIFCFDIWKKFFSLFWDFYF